MSLAINFRSVRTENGSFVESVILLNEEGVVRRCNAQADQGLQSERQTDFAASKLKVRQNVVVVKTEKLYCRCFVKETLCLLLSCTYNKQTVQ